MAKTEIRNGESPQSIEEYARRLARSHDTAEEGDAAIFVSWKDGEVRLIEVADKVPTSEDPMPFHFAAQPERGFPFSAVILLINSDLWASAADKSALLPSEWQFENFAALDELD